MKGFDPHAPRYDYNEAYNLMLSGKKMKFYYSLGTENEYIHIVQDKIVNQDGVQSGRMYRNYYEAITIKDKRKKDWVIYHKTEAIPMFPKRLRK